MKKVVLFIVFVLAAVAGFAQSHSYRDTLHVRYEQFDFDAWLLADTIGNRGKLYNIRPLHPETSGVFGYSDILQYNYTDNPSGIDVAGLSAVIFCDLTGPRTDAPPEYLLLYDALSDTFDLKARVQWYETDTAGRPFFRWIQRIADCHVPSSNGIDSTFIINAAGP